ncbi:MAG: NifU family protein [Patescibacteria group bacterium]|nr:NifU family protein [Patescibacteria group bacterium]
MKKNIVNIEDKIKKSLDAIRPSLQADGGDIEFVSFDKETGAVKVSLTGHCAHCPMSQITLKEGVEAILKKEVPEVKTVKN